MNPNIFKAYDIRGIYKKDFNLNDAYLIGRIFSEFVFKKTGKKKLSIVVGRDLRQSSLKLYQQILKSIKDAGLKAIAINNTTTPLHYFAINFLKADAGLIVTASHLGPKFNGFKLSLKGVGSIGGLEFYQFFKKRVNFHPLIPAPQKGQIIKRNIFKDYLKFLNLTYGNYQKIINNKYIVFDSDGDRIFFKDNQNKIIRPDLIACLLVKEYLKNKRRETVIIDYRSSLVLTETIRQNGGRLLFSPVGSINFKRMMKKYKAVIGAELSGHYYFKEFFNCDNGLLAAKKITEIVKKSKASLKELIQPYNKYFQSGELNFKVKDKTKKIKMIEKKYRDQNGQINKTDGLTVKFKDWWFNLRSSNTEDLLRLNLEAKSKKFFSERLKEVKKLIVS